MNITEYNARERERRKRTHIRTSDLPAFIERELLTLPKGKPRIDALRARCEDNTRDMLADIGEWYLRTASRVRLKGDE